MRIESNRIVYEMRDCIMCHGTGQFAAMVACEVCGGNGRSKRGTGKGDCRHCLGGRVYSKTLKESCGSCKGTGRVMENNCDSMPDVWWKQLTFRVYRHDRAQTYNEYLLAYGCVYSCTDYGDATRKTDEQVIESVRAHTYIQAIKVTRDDVFCDHVGIFVNNTGYSVRAVFSADGRDAINVIAHERGKEDGFVVGGRLAEMGLNGTLGAIYK